METLTPANDREIIEKILEGSSLRTVMVPDPALTSNRPEHVESYDLPHIVINGGTFWGKTRNTHLFHVRGERIAGCAAFCYTNAGENFFGLSLPSNNLVAFSRHRYKDYRWILVKNYRLIWDSQGTRSPEIVREEIDSASKLRIAMLDSEDVWNIHPVDLPMFELEPGVFRLKTEHDFYPSFCRQPNSADVLVGLMREAVGDLTQKTREMNVQFAVPVFCAFYSASSEGVYYNYYDIPRNTQQRYKRLKVFSDRV